MKKTFVLFSAVLLAALTIRAAASDRVVPISRSDASLSVVLTNWAYERDRVIVGVMLAPAALNAGEFKGYTLHLARRPIPASSLADQFAHGVEQTDSYRSRIARIGVRRDELPNAYLSIHFLPISPDAEPLVYCIPLTVLEDAFRSTTPAITVAAPSDAQLADTSWAQAFAPMIELPRL